MGQTTLIKIESANIAHPPLFCRIIVENADTAGRLVVEVSSAHASLLQSQPISSANCRDACEPQPAGHSCRQTGPRMPYPAGQTTGRRASCSAARCSAPPALTTGQCLRWSIAASAGSTQQNSAETAASGRQTACRYAFRLLRRLWQWPGAHASGAMHCRKKPCRTPRTAENMCDKNLLHPTGDAPI